MVKVKLTNELYQIAKVESPKPPKEQIARIGLELDSVSTCVLNRYDTMFNLIKGHAHKLPIDVKVQFRN